MWKSDPCCRWAWHNSHLTRKIAKEQRITPVETKPKAGKKRPSRPRASLKDKLSNLHLLLRVPGFARWPLQVRFFSEDVHEKWQTWCATAADWTWSGISITLDNTPPSQLSVEERGQLDSESEEVRKQEDLNKARVSSLGIGYGIMKPHVEKSLQITASEPCLCAVCTQAFEAADSSMLVCSRPDCRAASHMACLARRFLEEEHEAAVLPKIGMCPNCKSVVHWVDMVKELSLRARGPKELGLLFRKPRKPNTRTKKVDNGFSSELMVEEAEDEHRQEDCSDDVEEGPLLAGGLDDNDSLPDDWHNFEDEEDAMSVTSIHSDVSSTIATMSPYQSRPAASRLKVVIEESDWDGAEVLD